MGYLSISRGRGARKNKLGRALRRDLVFCSRGKQEVSIQNEERGEKKVTDSLFTSPNLSREKHMGDQRLS